MGRFWQHDVGYVNVAANKVDTSVDEKFLKIRLSIDSDISQKLGNVQ
jgi:hypothetical protein